MENDIEFSFTLLGIRLIEIRGIKDVFAVVGVEGIMYF